MATDDDTAEKATLTDFGIQSEEVPPRVQKRESVWTDTGECVAGWLGPCPQRDTWVLVKEVNGPDADGRGHKYEEFEAERGGAYAVSSDAFVQAEMAATRVLVVDHDSGTVFEWAIRDWKDTRVPKKYRWDRNVEYVEDEQNYGVVDAAIPWADHADAVFIPDHVDMSGDYR